MPSSFDDYYDLTEFLETHFYKKIDLLPAITSTINENSFTEKTITYLNELKNKL